MPILNFDAYWRDHGVTKGLQSTGREAQTAGKHVETLRGHGTQLAAGFAGFAAASIFRSFIAGARESNMISRITEQRIRSTGGAANVTAGQVGDLATAISNKTGADDEAIQSGENMLLTFTNVRNETGRGNDIFNQATQAVTDLAAGMNQGNVTAETTQKSAIMLGKALNDPIKGMTALGKAGVQFSNEQKTQIKSYVASGQMLKAQQVILTEVNRQFGGSAAAAADPIQRMGVILDNVGEDIGNKLLPALNKGADILAAIPAPVYMAGAAFVTLGVGAIGVAKGINAVRDIAQGTAGLMRVLGLRTAEAAAAEVVQAGAARSSAAATAASGDAAAVAGTKFGALAGKLGLAGAVVGLGALSAEATSWSGKGDVASVATDKLASSLLQMQSTGKATGPVFDLLNVNSMRFMAHIDTSAEAMRRFGDEASGAFSMSLADIAGRAQTGSERVDRFSKTAAQMDAALAALVSNGHGADASIMFEQLKNATGLTGDELQHVINRFPKYQAAAAAAEAQTAAFTRATGDTNSVLLGVQRAGSGAASIFHALAHAGDEVTLSAHAQHAAHLKVEQDLATLADRTLTLRGSDRELAAAQADLTASIRTNGRTLTVNTAAGRQNGDALDRVASSTLKSLAAHHASEPGLRVYAQRVNAARDALIHEAERAGMSTAAARKYADAILAVPRKQTTTYSTPGASAAKRAADSLAASLRNIHSVAVKVHLNADGNYVQGNRVLKAKGGAVPGSMGVRGRDSVPALLTPDEHVWTTRETAAVGGHGPMMRLRMAALAGQLQGFASGGPVNRYARTTYAQALPSARTMQSEIDRRVAAGAGGFQIGGGPMPRGGGVTRWAPMMRRALAASGLSLGLLPNELRQIQTESGGNPYAVQGNIGDVNNRSGDLAKGLLQIIGATFRAYHVPGTAWNVFDPWANMMASLNYQRHRYGGSIAAVIGHGHGYDGGGLARGPGWFRKGPRPERVLSPRQTAAFERLVPMLARTGGAAQVNITLQLTGSTFAIQDQIIGAVKAAVGSGRLSKTILPGVR